MKSAKECFEKPHNDEAFAQEVGVTVIREIIMILRRST